MAWRQAGGLMISIAFAGSVQAQEHAGHAAPPAVEESAASTSRIPLYNDLGSHGHPITTSSPAAQQYFDQGLRLTYGFNHAEAIAAFEEAARLDPAAPMPWWGIANALGPNINAPMEGDQETRAHAAAQEALTRKANGSDAERAYLEAIAVRYGPDAGVDRAARDSAYAKTMQEVATRFPDDLDAVSLAAEALMNLSPWYYWTHEGEPRPDTPAILTRLEGVLQRNPDHPGACHFYIHAVEAAHPEKALPCAERLAALMPGAGHIVHMPGHIYIRVGRWADAIAANEHAVHADQSYIADRTPSGIYPTLYYPHNWHFLSLAATMLGRGDQALDAARFVAENIPADLAAGIPDLQQMLAFLHLTQVTFGRWDEVLATPSPAPGLPITDGLVHYARGVAFAATERFAEAEAELDSVARIAASPPAGDAGAVLPIAELALRGEIAARRGELDDAAMHFAAAVKLEDALEYIEPPRWYYPIRHSLGAVLLRAGRAGEAERVYREDLKRFPNNGWSLFGLARSLEAQGKTEAAREADEQFDTVWSGADVTLAASRF
ncbi:MAG: hypothetical protein ABR599_00525 [Gemmatimonadota bacterium]